jgi:hypothetical protein
MEYDEQDNVEPTFGMNPSRLEPNEAPQLRPQSLTPDHLGQGKKRKASTASLDSSNKAESYVSDEDWCDLPSEERQDFTNQDDELVSIPHHSCHS